MYEIEEGEGEVPRPFTQEEIELLVEVNRILSSKLDLSQLLAMIMELARQVIKVDASSVLLLDEKTNELYFDLAVGGAGDAIKGVRVPVGQGIAGAVAQSGEPLTVNDAARDPRWRGDIDNGGDEKNFVTRAILACPMKVKGRLIGVVEAINRVDGAPFDATDVKIFEAFASQSAVAIDNARLFTNLAIEKKKFEKIFDEMADGAMLVGAKGNILSLNRKSQEWFSDLKPVHIKDFERSGYFWDPDPEGLLASPAPQGSLEIRRVKPKLFVLAGNWGRLEGEGGTGDSYVFLFRDITEAQRESFLQKNFLSMISHKLRTPLVAITGYMPLIKQEWDHLTETQKKIYDAIEREGKHLNYLVEDLLRFTTISGAPGELKLARHKVNAGRIMEDAVFKIQILVDSLKVKIERKIDFAAEFMGDTGLLIDMLKSLMENAIQFNSKPEKKLKLEVFREGDSVVFKIEDNGPGIPPEERDKIFQWFYQIEEDFTGQVRGMGLGLAFVKKVVELHKGRVDLTSRVGEGSCFTITLPVNVSA